MPLPAEQLEFLDRLTRLHEIAESALPGNFSAAGEISDTILTLVDEILEAANLRSVSDVRGMEQRFWVQGVDCVLGTADTTLECGDDLGCDDEENPNPDYVCTDWFSDALREMPEEIVFEMVKSGTVETPEQIMAWIDAQVGQPA